MAQHALARLPGADPGVVRRGPLLGEPVRAPGGRGCFEAQLCATSLCDLLGEYSHLNGGNETPLLLRVGSDVISPVQGRLVCSFNAELEPELRIGLFTIKNTF